MTLLDMALAEARQHWEPGEVVHLIPDRVYLEREADHFIHLHLAGFTGTAHIFLFDAQIQAWRPLHDVQRRYDMWSDYAKIWLDMQKKKGANTWII